MTRWRSWCAEGSGGGKDRFWETPPSPREQEDCLADRPALTCRAMIQQAHFHHFKSLCDLDIRLEPFTVLVGPNASGKTSILSALRMLAQLTSSQAGRKVQTGLDVESYLTSALTREAGWPIQLSCSGVEGDSAWSVESVTHEATSQLEVDGYGPKMHGTWASEEVESRSATIHWGALAGVLWPALFLRLNPASLAAPSYSEDVVPKMEDDGAGLASVLADMALTRPDDFAALQDSVRSIIPQVQRVKIGGAEVFKLETEPGGLTSGARTVGAIEGTRSFSTWWEHQVSLPRRSAKERSLFSG